MIRNIAVLALGFGVMVCVAIGTGLAADYFFANRPYDQIKNSNVFWKGPSTGQLLDLTKFVNVSGEVLPTLKQDDLILLVLVDSNCPMVSASSELISTVRSFAEKKGIRTFLISNTATLPSDAQVHSDSVFEGDSVYGWVDTDINPSPLKGMVAPSHLLVDGRGIVLNTFPGGSRDEKTRRDMMNEIVTDLEVVLKTRHAKSIAQENR